MSEKVTMDDAIEAIEKAWPTCHWYIGKSNVGYMMHVWEGRRNVRTPYLTTMWDAAVQAMQEVVG